MTGGHQAYTACLPNRAKPVVVCHDRPNWCAQCLAAIAGFLAEEIGWDLAIALDRPAEGYGADLHPHRALSRAELEQARELRRLVVKICWETTGDGRFQTQWRSGLGWLVMKRRDGEEQLIIVPGLVGVDAVWESEPIVADFEVALKAVAA